MTRTDAYRTTMVLITFIILCLVVWVTVIISNGLQETSVSTYGEVIVNAANATLCPGEHVIYTQTVSYDKVPVVVIIAASVWSIDEQRMVIYDTAPRYANFPASSTLSDRVEWAVPEHFSPGRYERRISSTAEGHKPDMFAVRFTVVDNC